MLSFNGNITLKSDIWDIISYVLRRFKYFLTEIQTCITFLQYIFAIKKCLVPSWESNPSPRHQNKKKALSTALTAVILMCCGYLFYIDNLWNIFLTQFSSNQMWFKEIYCVCDVVECSIKYQIQCTNDISL